MKALLVDLRIALLNLWRNTSRTSIAVLTVGGGAVAFLLAGGFITWIFHDMREATIHSQLGHIQVVRPGYFEKGIADPYAFLLPAQSELLETIKSTPSVEVATPRLAFSGLVSLGDATVAFIGEGVDPEFERTISKRIAITEGQDLTDNKEFAVILGEGLAKGLGAKVGDSVVLLATAANGNANAVEAKVSGLFSTISKDYDDNALRIPIAVARRLMRVGGATSWVILLKDTGKTEAMVKALSEKTAKSDFEFVPWTHLADFYNKTVVLFSKQVEVVKIIIGLIIVLTISNTQTMSVLERTTEIGTSLAIGLRRSTVLRLFLIEGGLIGVIGGVLGVLIGYGLSLLISYVGIPMPPPPGMVHGFTGEILVTPGLAGDALVMAVVTALLASIAPAWKASRMVIVDALRANQ